MKNFGLLAVGWDVEIKVWADYEQLLREFFQLFVGKEIKDFKKLKTF